MKTILVVNGEKYWKDIFFDFQIVQKSIQDTSWILKKGRLFVTDSDGVVEPDGILWRVGAIPPTELQTIALNLIDLANIPCVNSPYTLKMGFDRLSMLNVIKKQNLPIIDFNVVTKSTHLKNIQIDFPFVVKVGNYHGGFGKVLIEDEKKWQDIKDLLFITDCYITIEPYINYVRDIRYIVINDRVWAMSRKGKYWKANVETTDYQEIAPDQFLMKNVKKLQDEIKADILAVDILEEENGRIHIVEYNDIPGLSGFSDELKQELADILIIKMSENQIK